MLATAKKPPATGAIHGGLRGTSYSRFDQRDWIAGLADRCCPHRLGILVLELAQRAMSHFRVSWLKGLSVASGERPFERWSNVVMSAVPVVAAIAVYAVAAAPSLI